MVFWNDWIGWMKIKMRTLRGRLIFKVPFLWCCESIWSLLIFRLQVHFWMEKLIYSMRLNYSLVNALSIRTKLKPLPKLWLDWTHILTHYIMCLKRGSYHLLYMLTNWYQSWLCEIVCKSVWIIQIDNFGPSIWQILPT